MKRQLFALLVSEPDEVSLAALARAIAYAPRSHSMHVWRAFVRSQGTQLVKSERNTQRIRVLIGADRKVVGAARR